MGQARGEKHNVKAISVLGYYGNNNTGDEAILSCVIGRLREISPGTELTVLSANPTFTTELHGVASVHDLLPPNRLRYIVCALGRGRKNFFHVVNTIKATDVMIVGGGGLFFDRPDGNAHLLNLLGKIERVKSRGTRIAVMGVGVGPLYIDESRAILKDVLNLADLVAVRDDKSRALLDEMGVTGNNIHTTGDLAFLMRPADEKTIDGVLEKQGVGASGEEASIAICLRGEDAQLPSLQRSIIKFCDYACGELGANIWFVPFQFSGGDDDRPGLAELKTKLKDFESVRFFDHEMTANEILGVLGRADAVVGERFHSIVFSIINRRPFVGISYLPKVERLFQEINKADLCVRLDEIEPESLVSRFELVWKSRETAGSELEPVRSELEKKALMNFELFSDTYNLQS